MANIYDKILGEYRQRDLPDGVYFSRNGYTVSMLIDGIVVHSWTIDAPTSATITTGNPIGLLLSLTYTV
jgi:hypothetical protein